MMQVPCPALPSRANLSRSQKIFTACPGPRNCHRGQMLRVTLSLAWRYRGPEVAKIPVDKKIAAR